MEQRSTRTGTTVLILNEDEAKQLADIQRELSELRTAATDFRSAFLKHDGGRGPNFHTTWRNLAAATYRLTKVLYPKKGEHDD